MIARDGNSRWDPGDKNSWDFFSTTVLFYKLWFMNCDAGMEFYQDEILRIPGDNRVKGKRIIKMALG